VSSIASVCTWLTWVGPGGINEAKSDLSELKGIRARQASL
jgi:hypothetical protein